MAGKYSHEELVDKVQSPGWRLVTNDAVAEGTLEEILKNSHKRHKKGDPPGVLEEMETTIKLDALQIEKLWWFLGLPV